MTPSRRTGSSAVINERPAVCLVAIGEFLDLGILVQRTLQLIADIGQMAESQSGVLREAVFACVDLSRNTNYLFGLQFEWKPIETAMENKRFWRPAKWPPGFRILADGKFHIEIPA